MICQLGNISIPKLIKQKKRDDILVPTYVTDRMKRNTMTKVTRLLYPNYIFVRDLEAFGYLRKTFQDIYLLTYKEPVAPGVTAIMFHEIEEEDLKKYIDVSMEIIRKKQPFELKEIVKVIVGPFAGQSSKIIGVSENKVKLEMNLFSRRILVDFYKNDVEKV